ncbi:hypothetical protein LSH36_378g00004 [Paralvinella palmiformis]|uniref:ADP-ribosylation factor-like protein 15 n=1 Tax=Paralvinella palmiformis TaxID=53620 RepID=A0AAD9JE83_9ANNE|nr:hypothetical protein LSH36_378g00004 [Paralvinella palmiformis]
MYLIGSFSIKVVRLDDCILNVKEIGGGEKVRPFWHHYYAGAQGVIFVVNSASREEELEEFRDTLYKCLTNPALRGLPCLIIANHQDLPEARSEAKIREILELEEACSNRSWVLLMASKNNIGKLREDFSRYTSFLLQSLCGVRGPQHSTTSLELEGNKI